MGFDRKKWEWIWGKPHYNLQHNGSCVRCDLVEKFMVRVGAVIFCAKCTKDIFNSADPVREERDIYLKWLAESHRKSDLTWDEDQGKYIEDDPNEKDYKVTHCQCHACKKMREKYELSKKNLR